MQSSLLAKLILMHSSFRTTFLAPKSGAVDLGSGEVLCFSPSIVTVFKFGLEFTEPSGSSKAVISPVLKAKLQSELVASKHLFTFATAQSLFMNIFQC